MLDGPMNLLIDAIDASQSHVEFEQNIVRCIVLTESCQSTQHCFGLKFCRHHHIFDIIQKRNSTSLQVFCKSDKIHCHKVDTERR